MRTLKGFSDAGTPVFSFLGEATPALTEATRDLAPFTGASTVALKALGNAGEAAGPTFVEADPIVKKARNLARTGASPTTKLAKFFVSTKKTGGWDGLVDLIYNGTGALNEFDKYGHLIRSLVVIADCVEYVSRPRSGCKALFTEGGEASAVDSAALYRRIQEEMAEISGGTAATSTGPSTLVKPSVPAEPTPRLGEGEALEGEALEGEAPEGEGLGTRAAPSPPQRALLDYLLGP
jgi:hypothetical protein